MKVAGNRHMENGVDIYIGLVLGVFLLLCFVSELVAKV